MTDLHWRLQRAREDGNDPVERVALVVEALAVFHTRRSDLSFIGASEMRSLEPHHYRPSGRLRSPTAAPLLSGDEPAGNQRASGAYGPVDQGHACRADGKLKVSAPLAGRRIEPPGKTELVVVAWQLELPLLRPVRAAVLYRD